jgi:hypothetical protein
MIPSAKYRKIVSTTKLRHRSFTPDLTSLSSQGATCEKYTKDERKFFDMDYIFTKPVPNKQRENCRAKMTTIAKSNPFTRHKKFLDKKELQAE